MKKFIILLLAMLMSVSLAACGEYRAPTDDGITVPGQSGGVTPETPVDPNAVPFSVQLLAPEGESLPALDGISAIWTSEDGSMVYSAPFDEKGVAISYRPDGEFQVTLSGSLEGYTYDPNGYVANNDNTNVFITLYPLRVLAGGFGEMWNQFQLKDTGAYRFTFEKADQDPIFFEFNTSRGGKILRLESLLDITQNEVTPVLTRRNSAQFQNGILATVSGGGKEGTYTKNFVYDMAIEQNTGAGYVFALQVNSITPDAFPVNIDVLISYKGEYEYPEAMEMVEVPTDLVAQSDPTGSFVSIADEAYTLYGVKEFREDMVTKGEDGFYYYGDQLLYARLAKDVTNVFETDSGRGVFEPQVRLSCSNVWKNYTQAIKAFEPYLTSDGSYPVNDFLKEFLYNFSVSKMIFMDGDGTAEAGGYSSGEKDQWLFLCGFYREGE